MGSVTGPAAGPPSENHAASGPVMQLLAAGLQLWLRQRCEAIDSLEIHLHGSGLALLRGRLDGVTVLARRAVLQQVWIERVDLRSGPIRVQMGNLLKGRPVQLEQAFRISGRLALTPEGLSRTLAQPAWQWLGDALGEQLLGLTPLGALRIEGDALLFSGPAASPPVTLAAGIEARDGTVLIRSIAGESDFSLPMDPNIRIEQACLEAGMVQLQGTALVSP